MLARQLAFGKVVYGSVSDKISAVKPVFFPLALSDSRLLLFSNKNSTFLRSLHSMCNYYEEKQNRGFR